MCVGDLSSGGDGDSGCDGGNGWCLRRGRGWGGVGWKEEQRKVISCFIIMTTCIIVSLLLLWGPQMARSKG